MDCAPLNLAHFHERRAEKLIKRNRYDDAYKAIETSLLYVENAYKNVKNSKSLEILNTQKWDYERKLKQIHMRRQQYEKMKSKEIVPTMQIETLPSNMKTDIINAQSIARSIDRTIKEFNDKYGSTLTDSNNRMDSQSKNKQDNNLQNNFVSNVNAKSKETRLDNLENKIRRLNILDGDSNNPDDELPSLAPLELPFEFFAFSVPPSLAGNFPK